ncbi:MAG: phenylalanine--tRNA ligase subunit alpha [Calditerrivibrio sp.]|nr:phenylalanine--tRNA ligase subunit alpha [Calditerrivibrio sp.]MCA1932615.1 phenylalanine--tRNA ligase subunit alpha [Calditerrivibrio sp.]
MELSKELENYKQEIDSAATTEGLYLIWVKYLGKKGSISLLNKEMKNIPEDKRAEFGRVIVALREDFEARYRKKEIELKNKEINEKLEKESIDITLPPFPIKRGTLHPLTQVYYEIVDIFTSMGYELATGPEIELDFFNFEALNIPKEHPARDMQDTFYITDEVLLRTHTSPVQVRTMKKYAPPIKIIAPGKVFRCDSDITHTPMFHQVEGLLIDEYSSFADLKGALVTFIHRLFGEKIPVKFRPSFFPFTEPSAEVDMGCVICGGEGCRVCKGTGWLEILGCGMVHPKVLEAVGYDSDKYRGFAFGMGIERITMLKFGIDDLRLFYDNNIGFLKQF